MGTTTDKLNHLINTKEGIRQEINRAYNAEEVSTSDAFSSYIQKLEEHPLYVDMLIERSVKDIKITNATSIGNSAFQSCNNLTEASFPNATSIGTYAFYSCNNLTEASFPNATSIGNSAFQSCNNLTEASFPNATSIGTYAFRDCNNLTSVSFPNVTSIGNSAFASCTLLNTIYVGTNTSTICTLSDTNAFNNCTNLTNIYVPASLVNSYKSATNWSNYASKIKAAPQEGEVANKSITVTTSGIADYGWIPATSEYNVDGYDVYMSDNVGVIRSKAVMKIECVGYTELTLYIRSDGVNATFDCTIASTVNADTYPTAYNSSTVKAHTSDNQQSGTALNNYTAVTYTGLNDNDIIYIVYTKTDMPSFGVTIADRGFVLIPKQS